MNESRIRFAKLLGATLIAIMFTYLGLNSSKIVKALESGIVFSDDVVDLGRVTSGKYIEHTFRVWNASFRHERIGLVEPVCQCSVAHVSNYEIRPFHSASITMKVNTRGMPAGKTQKGLFITLLDGRRIGPFRAVFTVEPARN